ncbi:alpha/beta fold hydrolase [Streptomyces sp. NBC_01803]|uniref:alpha/beta fold hydrolase n=1 Tax=Streptomyces sp. NBC_01803 TaxID=2975946 RepID=UPI002DDBEC7B|nr:alpha/beta hydrolase [Streptomyces sp. NBC_01803]WSA43539.1 alpha/beta hydrolase [Streptomyces sp. NBC_01803]
MTVHQMTGSDADFGAITHRTVEVGGLELHIAEQGEGPLVLLLHGFPECWYSWRHQFAPLAAAGYRVVAPDQRGYARSAQPGDISAYTLLHLAGDVIGLIRALGEERAVVVGHDWGAPVAWTTALLRPDVVRAVAGLSVPPPVHGDVPPIRALRERFGDGFYQHYFQAPGVADAELARDPAATFRGILYAASGDSPFSDPPQVWVVPDGVPLMATIPPPEELPGWITEDDIAVFVAEYARHGEHAFTGGLNWYRNIDRNRELLAAFRGSRIEVPALFVAGDRDLTTAFAGGPDRLVAGLEWGLPALRRALILPGCGHWTQQERPAEVNAALLDLLDGLSADG